ncbi:hypothetical protein PVAG01_09182 [Phlyctema vagabunda]|uniref:Nitrogen regulatory protein areA GATA-like domain-containing protein n=1 Tax=Phlyctema vagabunda TaxID=108571 RepID=A0ABR4P6L7_9HELO
MAMILPKGIVVNSPEIEGQIERIDREPLKREEIARFWKVYTTTGRRLRDPTAERLENYWWRIWGSRKRELKGATVARLFAQISDGESFVPLRSPVNRDEGSSPLKRARPAPVTSSSSSTAIPYGPGTTSPASKPLSVMPPPILKKSRGPSSTGPRPTARFISPHDSEVETDPLSPISPNSHVVVQPPSQPPSPSRQQKIETQRLAPASAGKKKNGGFIASTATKKKRPVMVRRQSSQTSQTSQSSSNDSSTRPVEAATFAALSNSPSVAGDSKQPEPLSRFQEVFSPSSDSLSPKKRSSATRPAPARRISARKTTPSVKRANGRSLAPGRGSFDQPGPSTAAVATAGPLLDSQRQTENLAAEESDQVEVQKVLLQEANENRNINLQKTNPPPLRSRVQISHEPTRSRSQSEQYRQDSIATRLQPAGVKSTVGLDSTLASATTGITEPVQLPPLESRREEKGKGRDPEELKRTELFSKKPVQPITDSRSKVPSEVGMLSKSKSQLTLLLEKDRFRNGEHKKR